MENMKHLVIVYPQDTGKAAVLQLAAGLASALRDACGEMPLLVRSDTTVLCRLCRGSLGTISQAIDAVTDAYSRWLVLPVAAPFAVHGLATAVQWLARPG